MFLGLLNSGSFCQPQSKNALQKSQHNLAPLPSKACLELVTWKSKINGSTNELLAESCEAVPATHGETPGRPVCFDFVD